MQVDDRSRSNSIRILYAGWQNPSCLRITTPDRLPAIYQSTAEPLRMTIFTGAAMSGGLHARRVWLLELRKHRRYSLRCSVGRLGCNRFIPVGPKVLLQPKVDKQHVSPPTQASARACGLQRARARCCSATSIDCCQWGLAETALSYVYRAY